jgi:hypothetical protein
MALGRNLAKWAASIASAIAHFGLAIVAIAAVSGDAVSGAPAWLLAVAWAALAFYLVWNWWFFRWRIALAPIGFALVLWQLGGWPGAS